METILQNLVHKPKKINLQPITRMTTEIPVKKDYLKELITKREKKEKKMRAMSSKNSQDNINPEAYDLVENSLKWEKAVNNKGGSLIENINIVQKKAQTLEKEADEKEKLLEFKGGIENNPELGKKVSNLLIDSIQAKINILKKMNEV